MKERWSGAAQGTMAQDREESNSICMMWKRRLTRYGSGHTNIECMMKYDTVWTDGAYCQHGVIHMNVLWYSEVLLNMKYLKYLES